MDLYKLKIIFILIFKKDIFHIFIYSWLNIYAHLIW